MQTRQVLLLVLAGCSLDAADEPTPKAEAELPACPLDADVATAIAAATEGLFVETISVMSWSADGAPAYVVSLWDEEATGGPIFYLGCGEPVDYEATCVGSEGIAGSCMRTGCVAADVPYSESWYTATADPDPEVWSPFSGPAGSAGGVVTYLANPFHRWVFWGDDTYAAQGEVDLVGTFVADDGTTADVDYVAYADGGWGEDHPFIDLELLFPSLEADVYWTVSARLAEDGTTTGELLRDGVVVAELAEGLEDEHHLIFTVEWTEDCAG
ncbi:MAG: hypothetical protein ACOZNI_24765 [Myxococcota bacterium]